ncbi:unnamed protein product, partial [Coregonus sp. 'balchen']
VNSVIGIGVGAGAYILSRLALNEPALVEGLVLINVDPCAKGWMDWAASKMSGWTSNLVDIVMAHHFSDDELSDNQEITQTYRLHIAQDINQENLALFCNAYNSRRDLEIERPITGLTEDTVECNSRLNPTKTTLLKPGKLAEAFKYFVQGMGYMPTASMTRLVRSRTHSASSMGSVEGTRSRTHTQLEDVLQSTLHCYTYRASTYHHWLLSPWNTTKENTLSSLELKELSHRHTHRTLVPHVNTTSSVKLPDPLDSSALWAAPLSLCYSTVGLYSSAINPFHSIRRLTITSATTGKCCEYELIFKLTIV